MGDSYLRGLILLLCSALLPATPAVASDETDVLGFEDRVRAQAAIERVYHSHRIDTPEEFETAVPAAVLEAKVRKFFRQSNALERQWKTTVTAQMLDRELERMVRDTNDPDRLRELFEALGEDSVLIRECLARPILVERLVHNFFAFDEGIHDDARREAEQLRRTLVAGRIDPGDEHPRRVVEELSKRDRDVEVGSEDEQGWISFDADSYDEWRSLAPAGVGVTGEIVEFRDSYEFRVLLAEEADRARVALFSVPKKAPSKWWDGFAATPVRTVAGHGAFQQALPEREDCGEDRWRTDVESPSARSRHTAVWTGSEMIVWGPHGRSGSRYDPATDTWTSMSTSGAPELGYGLTAVWTGTEMIVWGGCQSIYYYCQTFFDIGGRYNPVTDSWTPVATEPAPVARAYHSAVWTGTEMIVWGGQYSSSGELNTGGRYDPATDSWSPTTTVDAPVRRYYHSAVWTGETMFVWGGADSSGSEDSGGRYDPSTDTWLPVSATGAPVSCGGHSAIWTGQEVIVWGCDPVDIPPYPGTGGRYDPVTDVWSPVATENAPYDRGGHTAIWTGSLMVVWGGYHYPTYLGEGKRYDPVTDIWTRVYRTNEPVVRSLHTAVWTGSLMIVWGGQGEGATYLDSGGRYDPASNSWTRTAESSVWDREMSGHTAVWTGSEMIVWGGKLSPEGSHETNTGTVYNPTTGTRFPTNLVNAPVKRRNHTAVWTGTEMIVWGGGVTGGYYYTGGRYDPVQNSWMATSLDGAPTGRTGHTAVWTGSRMIVWAGFKHPSYVLTGGQYDPVGNTWTPTSVGSGVPSARGSHTAVWTGTEMIAWGGADWNNKFDTGGRYDPELDEWRPVTMQDAPSARAGHTTLWTGTSMITWGGVSYLGYTSSGSRYDPVMDEWDPIATSGAPSPRINHSAVWTGGDLVVWGGRDPDEVYFGDGARYNLQNNSWTALATEDAPTARAWHEAVWTGEEMIVWGGRHEDLLEPPWGHIEGAIWVYTDPDGDGLCGEDDCDTLNPNCGLDCTDQDDDGFCVTHDCDETNPYCTWDCTDADSDGVCATHDCDESSPDCTFDCSDADGDGVRDCDGDCDETNPNCTYDCTDSDSDGFCVLHDCDDAKPNCTIDCTDADADGFCITTDCDDSYASCTVDCTDADGDGALLCAGDCDDSNPNCTFDCADVDSDGFCVGIDCDDSTAQCTTDCTDADDDGYCVTTDCDETNPNCTYDCVDADFDGYCWNFDCDDFEPNCTVDCTDVDSDGFCNLNDCDDSNPYCDVDCTDSDEDDFCFNWDCDDSSAACTGLDCSDADGDGVRVCEDDCDDLNPHCTTDCTDADSDDYCVTTDCDDSVLYCTTDCTDADGDGFCVTWDCDESEPDCTLDCSDGDGDGLAACRGDCDDTNPDTLPGLPEICTDNSDNDCDGLTDAEDEPCSGLVAGSLEFTGTDSLAWEGTPVADSYGLYRGTIPETGFAGYDHLCEATRLADATAVDSDLPGSRRGFYYLVAGQSVDQPGDRFIGGPLGTASSGASRPTSETITCGPRLYVDPDVVLEGGDGLSWATAYSAVSLALDHGAFLDRGSEIWIRDTIHETGAASPEVSRPGVRLLGGFNGAETHSWERSPETTPTVWSGGGGLLLFEAHGTSVELDGLTMREAISAFVGNPAGRLTRITDVTMEQISGYGLDLTYEDADPHSLIVRDVTFDSPGLSAIRVVAEAGLLTGEIRDNVFRDWSDAAVKLEARPSSSAEIGLDIVSNVISGGGDGIVLGAHVDDAPASALQFSFVGSNLVHGTAGSPLRVEASGYFDFADSAAVVDASPRVVGNTFVDGGGDGVACSATRTDLTAVPLLHMVRATPQLWDNLITHNMGAGIAESPDDPVSNWIAEPEVVGNGLYGNASLYLDEGTTYLTLIDDVNALDGAADNFDGDPVYHDRAAEDYHLAFGTVLGFRSSARYLANVEDPGLGLLWTMPGFDASNWRTGPYGIGFDIGPSPNATALLKTRVSPAAVSVYTRISFTVDDLSAIHTLTLGTEFDDGVVAWINGVEVFRSATVPAGPLDWNSTVGEHESSNGQVPLYEEYDISAAGVPVLLEGENLLAVAVWNVAGTDDMIVVPRLILQQESPAVDAGHLDAPRLPVEDVDGDRRENDSNRDGISRPDVGADERW